MSISNDLFQLNQISYKIEEQTILQEISLSLEKEKIYALIGPSGAGKTTLLHLLAGLKEPSKGELLLKGSSPKQAVISIVPQDYGLLPWQTAGQAVSEGRKISQGKKLIAEDKEELQRFFEQMALTELSHKYPNQLSGGQKQRVAIARGLASRSEVLLMDEPFSALDTFTKEKAQRLFLECWQEAPRLTVFVTHDIEEALLLAHEVIILQGNPGTVKKLFPSPFQKKTDLDRYRRSETLFQTSLRLRKEIEE